MAGCSSAATAAAASRRPDARRRRRRRRASGALRRRRPAGRSRAGSPDCFLAARKRVNWRAWPICPTPRGELSAALLDALARPGPRDRRRCRRWPASPTRSADDDLQLALYLCYELHYRGLPGVDDALGVGAEPARVPGRRSSGEFEAALREVVPRPAEPVPAAEIDLALREISRARLPAAVALHPHAGDARAGARVPRPPLGLPAQGGRPALVGAAAAVGRRRRRRWSRSRPTSTAAGAPDWIHAELFARAMRALGLDAELRRLPRPDPGDHAGHRQPDVAVRAAPPPARGDRRPPRAVRDDLLDAQPPLRRRAAPARLRRRRDAVLRRARRGRRRARERGGGRSGRRPRAPGPRARRRGCCGAPRRSPTLDARWCGHVLGCWRAGRTSLRYALDARAGAWRR